MLTDDAWQRLLMTEARAETARERIASLEVRLAEAASDSERSDLRLLIDIVGDELRLEEEAADRLRHWLDASSR